MISVFTLVWGIRQRSIKSRFIGQAEQLRSLVCQISIAFTPFRKAKASSASCASPVTNPAKRKKQNDVALPVRTTHGICNLQGFTLQPIFDAACLQCSEFCTSKPCSGKLRGSYGRSWCSLPTSGATHLEEVS